MNRIGRVNPVGTITEFPLSSANTHPWGITAGSDGNVWYGALDHVIGRITPDGTLAEFLLPSLSTPEMIALGPDGNVWFASNTQMDNSVGRVTPTGIIVECSIPTADSVPIGITAGPE